MGKVVRFLIDRVDEGAIAFEEATLTNQGITRRIIGNTGGCPAMETGQVDNIGGGKLIVFIHAVGSP
ncbi:hypothetical protein FQZ97_831990 [compost metagenome]